VLDLLAENFLRDALYLGVVQVSWCHRVRWALGAGGNSYCTTQLVPLQ
jgi:hypothetical protein